MESERTPRFWELARAVVGEARRHGLVVPGFRSPPRRPGAVRTVRRTPGGGMVAVAWRGRSPAAVVADMVDGVVLVNGLDGTEAAACRRLLWAGLGPMGRAPADAGQVLPAGREPLAAAGQAVPAGREPLAAAGQADPAGREPLADAGQADPAGREPLADVIALLQRPSGAARAVAAR